MKRIIVVLFVLTAASIATAQVDTLEYGDPWYQFNPLPPQDLYFSLTGGYDMPPIQFQSYPNMDNTLYGIAVVMDTVYRSIEDIISSFVAMLAHRTEIVDSTYAYYENGDTRLLHVDARFTCVDSIRFNENTRQCKFKYITNFLYDGPRDDTSFFNCFEFYFDTPYEEKSPLVDTFSMDTFYVGCFMEGNTAQLCFTVNFGHYATSEYWTGATNEFWMTGQSGDFDPGSLSDATLRLDMVDITLDTWGGFFPIVQLRCTAPKRLHETGRGRGEFSIAWDAHDDAVGWQLAIAPLWASIEDGEIIDLDSATSYTFTGLDPTQNYIYSVRKTCHYATSNYDTLITSEWLTPRRVIFNASTMEVSSAIEASFSLAPNPAHGRTEVTLAAPATTGTTVELHDLAGRLLRTLRPAVGATTLDLDLAGLPPAAYFLRLSSPAGTSVRRLLVR